MFASGPRWTSTVEINSNLDRCAQCPHRRFDGDQRTHDAAREMTVGQRCAPVGDRRDEFHALVLQRLARLDLRAHDIAVAHEQLELAEGVRDRLLGGNAALEEAYTFAVIEVVE